ncbi:unnamed protein product, partial [Bubo scandiacus]
KGVLWSLSTQPLKVRRPVFLMHPMPVPPSSCCARCCAEVVRVPPVSSHPPPLRWGINCSPGRGRRLRLVTPSFALERCGQTCLPVPYP